MALQLGPVIGHVGGGVEMFEPAFTPNTTNTRRTVATQVVGEGQWLVAVEIPTRGTNPPGLYINGTLTTGGGSGSSHSTVAVVDGPTTITIEGVATPSGHVYIVRIA